MDIVSGAPGGNCVYTKLSQEGFAIVSLDSADDKDLDSLKFICNLAPPGNTVGSKVRPECLKSHGPFNIPNGEF